jgi:hypothetical protein
MMKRVLVYAIAVIILLSIVLIANFVSNSFESNQILQQQYESEQSSILRSEVEQSESLQAESEAEQSSILQSEVEQHAKLQIEAELHVKSEYESISQRFEEKSEQFDRFAKKFISVYEEFGYELFDNSYGFENAGGKPGERLEYESNIDTLDNMDYIRYVPDSKGYSYILFYLPSFVDTYEYCDIHEEYHYFTKRFLLVYIPDAHMDDESIVAIHEEIFNDGDLQRIKDNLFLTIFLEYPCIELEEGYIEY